eukprot:scaffold42779_cov22-Prasinocladus_malaysianus.AAC.1
MKTSLHEYKAYEGTNTLAVQYLPGQSPLPSRKPRRQNRPASPRRQSERCEMLCRSGDLNNTLLPRLAYSG